MFWNLIEIFLLMIDIFLLENNLIKFNRKKSIQQQKTYQKISYYLNRIMSKENFAHFCIIFLICFLRNVIEFVFTSRNFTCTSDSLLSNLDDERKESLNSKVFGCDIQIGQKGFKQTNNLKTYFASGCDLSPKHFTIWNSWSISESPRK